MNKESYHPGKRIGIEQPGKGMKFRDLKDGTDPEKTKSAGTKHRYDRRSNSVAHTADRSDNDIHHTAGEIYRTNNPQPNHTADNDNVIFRVNAEKGVSEKNSQISKHQSGSNRTGKREKQDFVDTRVFLSSNVLTRKGESGLMKGIHRNPDKSFNVGGSGTSGNHKFTKGVDRRLNDNIRKCKDNALKPCRNSDFYKHP